MKVKRQEIRLASTDSEAVHADVRKIWPDWNGSRQTLQLREDYTIVPPPEEDEPVTETYISGYRLDIIPIPDRVVTPAQYDEEGNQLTPPVYAGETRIDIVTIEGFPVPELSTRVHPETADSRYA